MSLVTNTQSRYSSQILINASNPQSSGATSVDSTRLSLAATDVSAVFEVLCGVEYDDSNALHVLYGVEGVLVRLLLMTGQTTIEAWDKWKSSLKDELALVTGRDRIPPTTDSLLSPTEDTPNTLPATDRTNFKRYIPGAPNTEDLLD